MGRKVNKKQSKVKKTHPGMLKRLTLKIKSLFTMSKKSKKSKKTRKTRKTQRGG